MEQRLIALNGRVIDVDVQAASYYIDGKLEIQVVCRDVTVRKKAEQELIRHMRHSNFRAAIGLGLSQTPTLPEMLQCCAQAMVTHLNATFARVWIMNELHDALELQAGAGVCQRLDELQARVLVGQQTVGRIAVQLSPFVTDTIDDCLNVGDSHWASSYQLTSFAGYPLLVEGRCLGVIAIFSREVIDQDSLDSLAMAANGLAQYIERKNSVTMLAELNSTLEQRVIQRTLELKSSEQFNRATLDALSAHVAVVDFEGKIVATNVAWRKFAEENSADCLTVSDGSNYLAVCDAAAKRGDADAALVANALRDVLSGRLVAWSHEYPCHSPTEQRWYVCQVTLGYINQQPHAVVAQENITSIKRAQVELREAKEKAVHANRSKSEFLAMMSHELRTPLNGILGMNELLLTTELNDRQREYITTCSSSGKVLLQLINDILDLSKIEAGKLELDPRECSVEAFTYDVIEILSHAAQAKKLLLNCRVALDACVTGLFDDTRLRQVLANLLSNAVKFTASGSISVVVDCIAKYGPTTRLRFAVTDTGIGIPAERLDRLFKSFSQVDSSTTRQFGGTGLGLSICKQLIELMGGKIGVESRIGVGTTFWFELDIATTVGVTDTKRGLRSLNGIPMVVVDNLDREPMQISECLQSWGCQLQQVATIADAVTATQKAMAGGHPIRMIMVDCRLSVGDEFAKLQKLAAASNADMIGLETQQDTVSRNDLYRRGFRHLLADPVRPGVLFDTLNRLMAARIASATGKTECSQLPGPTVSKVSGHILVAEDNRINQLYITELLKHLGCTSDLVVNGEEAVAAVQKHCYNLVLMDCQMPEMDGFTAAREIRKLEDSGQLAGRLPIVALTANALKGDREQCLQAGMDEYLSKPIETEKIRIVLQNFIGSNSSPFEN